MSRNLFQQNVIAFIWDFDKTLIPGYMQEPLFRRYGVDSARFWEESNGLTDYYLQNEQVNVNRETVYLNHILTYVANGQMAGLTNAVLRECGADIEFYPGLPDFLGQSKQVVEQDPEFSRHGITVEHYIVSTGLRQMILGSKIAKHVAGVWACEFIEAPASPDYLVKGMQPGMALIGSRARKGGVRPVGETSRGVSQLGYTIDNTTKTRAVFEINKGSNVETIDVNARMSAEDRRVPFPHMIYTADGPSDVPVFSVLNQYRGHTFGVYDPDSLDQFRQVKALQEQGRIQSFAPADYQPRTQAYLWLTETAKDVARRIVLAREEILSDRVKAPPAHIIETRRGQPATEAADGGTLEEKEAEEPATGDTVGLGG